VEPTGPQLPDYVTVLKDNVRLDLAAPHQFAVSPDTNSIAYFDLDTLWCQYLPNGPPTKLDELANRRSLQTVALHWNNASDRIFYVFNLATEYSRNPRFNLDAYASSRRERGTKLTTISSDKRWTKNHNIRLTEDATHVVGTRPDPVFLWNIAAGQFAVCCFDILVPSATSDRWLGVEIDTRQLVIVDKNFEIIRRVEYFFTSLWAIHLSWSPDERYASVTPSQPLKMQSLRVDLHTGEAEPIAVDYYESLSLAFTGNDGELFYTRSAGRKNRHIVTTIPMSGETPRFNFEHTYSRFSVVPSADFRYVAVAEGVFQADERQPSSFRWQIVDETGAAWLLAKEDGLLASYVVLGFANNGQTIVAYGDEQIVTMPLKCILEQ
jgi:hypothetical protein